MRDDPRHGPPGPGALKKGFAMMSVDGFFSELLKLTRILLCRKRFSMFVEMRICGPGVGDADNVARMLEDLREDLREDLPKGMRVRKMLSLICDGCDRREDFAGRIPDGWREYREGEKCFHFCGECAKGEKR